MVSKRTVSARSPARFQNSFGMSDSLSLYSYDLPPELIAAQPLPERDASRLLVLRRPTGEIAHRAFRDLPDLLRPHDLLVLNETKVVPARLVGTRSRTGGKWEGLFLGVDESGRWRLIGQTRGKLQPGESITLQASDPGAAISDQPEHLELTLISKSEEGEWKAAAGSEHSTMALLDRFGSVPLPPYIERETPSDLDRTRYQTTYARTPGAVAAPTAGLHFTPEVFARCNERGVNRAFVTLHVGLGTFRPVTAERLSDHVMHQEWCDLPQQTVEAIAAAKAKGGRIIAIGTTTVRTLESVAARGPLQPFRGETDLFIRPPYEFRVVDAMVTNFHLPKSTLLVLLSAFAGREAVLNAYAAAIAKRYRFYSYGDAMLID